MPVDLPALYDQMHYVSQLLHRLYHAGEPDGAHLRGQGRLLGLLLKEDGLSQRQLADSMRIRPASLGELIQKNELRGYIEKRRDPKDHRVTKIYLTDSGREIALSYKAHIAALPASVFGDLEEGEQEQLQELMTKLAASIENKLKTLEEKDPA